MARAHLCDVPGCGRSRKRWQRLCEPCFAALPGDIRTAIIDAHNTGRKADWRRERKRAADHLSNHVPAHPAHSRRVSPERAYELQQRLLGEH